MRKRLIKQDGEVPGAWDKQYALQTSLKYEEYEDDEDDDMENDFVEMPRDMSYSSTEGDGYHRHSLQIPNCVGSSAVSSPAEQSPEAPYNRHRYQVASMSSLVGNSKLSKPQACYKECQKNHAASIGGQAVDGCGEFLPNGKEGTLEALMCAACLCHRNFHRREIVGGDGACVCGGGVARSQFLSGPYPLSHCLRSRSPIVLGTKVSQLPSSVDIFPHAQIVTPAAQHSDAADDDDDDDEPPQNPRAGSSKKKWSRTKFSPEQKERMLDFATSLGWRISKHDEEAVQQFCNDVKVKRNVFKVWLHNNKVRKLNGSHLVGES